MGGFTSAPPILVARGMGIPTFLHESNTIPGRANRWLSRFVNEAFIGFPDASARLKTRKTKVTGTPVRPQFVPGNTAANRTALGLNAEHPVLLVTGGSQGASGLNDLVIQALPALVKQIPNIQLIHLTGPSDAAKVEKAVQALGIKAVVRPFFGEMNVALGAATACVSRAGASSLAELAAMRIPSVLVPFPAATDNHQFYNALAFQKTGAAHLLEQKNARPEDITAIATELIQSNAAREKMQTALEQWHAPRAAEKIAENIMLVVNATWYSTEKATEAGQSPIHHNKSVIT
jgi:UDP-N-acetylglucosamine--N-acetylmuramyl-(pentapeptide) pyrophosphoryl-undecaprenol N-acetylglucosamine transferase